jgi:hypothetical protein
VLLLKTYHKIAHPIVLLSSLRLSPKPGAKIAIIDRNGDAENHGVNRDVVNWNPQVATIGSEMVSRCPRDAGVTVTPSAVENGAGVLAGG